MNKRYLIYNLVNNHDFNTEDIMNIIINHKIDYSSNSNGIFINLSLIDDTIITQIYNKITEIIKTRNQTNKKTNYTKSKNKPLPVINLKKDNLNIIGIDQYLITLSKQQIHI